MPSLPAECDVLICGGGPCGLMLANELGRRGIGVVLVDQKTTGASSPKANATQARTMEHFRRLGFAEEVRALGLPAEYPTDIAYFTRFARHEIGRFRLPSARQARESVATLSGSWNAAELPHRVSQNFVEAVLRRHAQKLPGVTIAGGWRLMSFADRGTHVEAQVERTDAAMPHAIRASFLVGADGARSTVRQLLGLRYVGETGVVRDFFGGRMYAVHFRAPSFYASVAHAPAWMYVSFNRERRAFLFAIDGKSEFVFHTQLRTHEDESAITPEAARELVRAAVGAPINIEVLARDTWTAGYTLVAERFQIGRVLIGGDAAHLFTPTGGLGYNTAIDDAVNLGWKLAAVLTGQGGEGLIASYERERRPLALRNTDYARKFADSIGLFEPAAEIEEATGMGEAARRDAGAYLEAHARREFNIPGITFGGRYDGSPVIVSDGSAAPPDDPNTYIPSACPGGRAPHAWFSGRRSLYDMLSFGWTLLRLGPNSPPAAAFTHAAAAARLDLAVVDLPDGAMRELYAADLALVRPDQIVAWRGGARADAEAVIACVCGRAPGA